MNEQASPVPGHQLAECLGKGAFGSVWRALNWQTGETCAVKQERADSSPFAVVAHSSAQIGLSNIHRSELPEIMAEIDLLKNLQHANIVSYRGYCRTATDLYILLELCENGSLLSICKKFGKFPEGLVAVYVYQVLEGLVYLHDQGIIHRDVKGSNILATKEGSVKLADFGVATKVGPLRDAAVVGSPYWMAPEVIDQSGATTASDIWSVGCVVIELLEGRPPHFHLDPMLALFRVVNDDCPPLPESASPMARDFLLSCFQKDANLRTSARKLLKHPWMAAAKRRLDQTKEEQRRRTRPIDAHQEAKAQVQEWNRAIKDPVSNGTIKGPPRAPLRPDDQIARVLQSRTAHTALPQALSRYDESADNPLASSTATAATAGSRRPRSSSSSGSSSSDKENWDSDFEGISSGNFVTKSPTKGATMNGEDNTKTLRASAGPRPPSLPRVPSGKSKAMVEDYPDMEVESESRFQSRIASIQSKAILHPRDVLKSKSKDDSTGSDSRSRSQTIRPSPSQMAALSSASTVVKTYGSLSCVAESPEQRRRTKSASPHLNASTSSLHKYTESDDEDYSDLVDKTGGISLNGPRSPSLQLTERLSSRSWLGDDGSDEDDPFTTVEAEDGDPTKGQLTDVDLLDDLARDRAAQLADRAQSLVAKLSRSSGDSDVIAACGAILEMHDETPEIQGHVVRRHGLIALVENLQVRRTAEVIGAVLRVISRFVQEDPETLEKLCLLGVTPIILAYTSNRYQQDIRLEAALFIGAMVHGSQSTLQMLIACGGLRALVQLLDEDYLTNNSRAMVWLAVDGIYRILEMRGLMSRIEVCRFLAQEGLLPAIAIALTQTMIGDDSLAESAQDKIVSIFFVFSQSELESKDALSDRKVAYHLIKALDCLEGPLLATLLKTLKHITMSPGSLENLQRLGLIPTLVRLLASQLSVADKPTDLIGPVISSLYNLCRLSKIRQEEAAQAGAIPALIRLVATGSQLQQFALPILCDFAQASACCRTLLWQHKGLDFYLGLLRQPYWSLAALESITAWHQDQMLRVETSLLQPTALEAIGNLMSQSKGTAFGNLLDPLHKLLKASPMLARALVHEADLLERIGKRLEAHRRPGVRLSLLRLLRAVCDALPPLERDFARRQPNLVKTLDQLAVDDQSVLVRKLAKGISKDTSQGKRSSSTTSMGLMPSTMDRLRLRTRSDGQVAPSSSSPTLAATLNVREDVLPRTPLTPASLSRMPPRVRRASSDRTIERTLGIRLKRTPSSRPATPSSPPL